MGVKKEDLDLKKGDIFEEPISSREEKTLVEAIAEDLKKKRSLADIRKEYTEKDYPRLVVETAIEEARQSFDKSKKKFDLSELYAKDEDVHDDHKKKDEEKSVSILPIVVIILIIWLGIMISFYLANPFGKAVDKFTPKHDQSFLDFCKKDLSEQGTYLPEESDVICKIGDRAIKDEKIEMNDLKKECNNKYYVIKEVNSCAGTLNSVIQRYLS